jgi:3-oxoacyl-[acyl-carrier-protein] synthase II
MRRVAVTGLGVVCAVGKDCDEFFANLMAGRSGIQSMRFDLDGSQMTALAACVRDDEPAKAFPRQTVSLDRFTQLALTATSEAVRRSGIQFDQVDLTRAGVSFGTAIGGISTIEAGYIQLLARDAPRVNPLTIPIGMNNAAAARIGLEYGLEGPNLTYSVACSSSAFAVGEAAKMIRHGQADVMIAGGAEALLTLGMLKAWEGLRVLAKEDQADPSASCRPFSLDRTGIVLGEGAATIVLEDWRSAEERGAPIVAELVGYGVSNDATHITRPSAVGQARATQLALCDAKVSAQDIGYINAHAAGTPVGDRVESSAIKQVFGDHATSIPVSSTKSMHGHTMGAAGALEFVTAIMAMTRKSVPPTANLRIDDPECDLNHVRGSGRTDVEIPAVMSNSFAFGGANAVLIARAV